MQIFKISELMLRLSFSHSFPELERMVEESLNAGSTKGMYKFFLRHLQQESSNVFNFVKYLSKNNPALLQILQQNLLKELVVNLKGTKLEKEYKNEIPENVMAAMFDLVNKELKTAGKLNKIAVTTKKTPEQIRDYINTNKRSIGDGLNDRKILDAIEYWTINLLSGPNEIAQIYMTGTANQRDSVNFIMALYTLCTEDKDIYESYYFIKNLRIINEWRTGPNKVSNNRLLEPFFSDVSCQNKKEEISPDIYKIMSFATTGTAEYGDKKLSEKKAREKYKKDQALIMFTELFRKFTNVIADASNKTGNLDFANEVMNKGLMANPYALSKSLGYATPVGSRIQIANDILRNVLHNLDKNMVESNFNYIKEQALLGSGARKFEDLQSAEEAQEELDISAFLEDDPAMVESKGIKSPTYKEKKPVKHEEWMHPTVLQTISLVLNLFYQNVLRQHGKQAEYGAGSHY